MNTENKNIVAVIEALGDTIQKQKEDIFFKNIQIDDLRERLERAEAATDELKRNIDTLIKKVEADAGKRETQGVTE